MEPALKNKWVEALKSGKYAQTVESLWSEQSFDAEIADPFDADFKDEEGFCCLGVLCEIQGWERTDIGGYRIPIDVADLPDGRVEQLSVQDHVQSGPYISDGKMYVEIDGMFPQFVAKKFGLTKMVTDNKNQATLQEKLAGMNDIGKSFKDIAKYIERVKF